MRKFLLALFLIVPVLSLTGCVEIVMPAGENGLSHEHEFNLIYRHDEITHYLECSCGEKTDIGEHIGGTNSCTEYAICEVCYRSYGELLEHDYTIAKSDETNHWLECECGNKSDVAKHEHLIENYDTEYHYLECECKDIINKEKHILSNGVVTKYSTDKEEGIMSYSCSGCEYVFEEKLPKISGREISVYPSLSNADVISYQGRIYTYGGSPDGSGRTNSVYCYDTNTDKLYKLNVKLRAESTSHRTILVGDKVYIFGGLNSSKRLNTIQIHDLTNQTIDTLEMTLPFGINCFQVGYYQDKIYLVCGYTDSGATNKIYEFDINTNQLKELECTVPNKVFKGAWCSVGKYMYLIGGTSGKRLNTIYRFDMENNVVEEMNGKLPDYISQSRAVYDGAGNIYIFGGTNEKNELVNYVVKYSIEEDVCELQNYTLPYNLANLCVAKTKNGIYILGGDNAIRNVILKLEDNEFKNMREVL